MAKTTPFTQDFSRIIGQKQSISNKDIATIAPSLVKHAKSLKPKTDDLLSIPYQQDDLAEILEIANNLRNHFAHIVILGTGGSTLNPQNFTALAGAHQQSPTLYYMDNTDPLSWELFFQNIPLKETAFLAISKSGETIETVSQLLACLQRMHQDGIEDLAEHIVVVTEQKKSTLRSIAESVNAKIIEHNSNIGGRFASFTNVGLLPAALSGLDIEGFREGAKGLLESLHTIEETSDLIQGVASVFLLQQQGYENLVMMPYIDQLGPFTNWYRQLIAESLGKQGNGLNLIKAAGPADQHSQLQLYLDGVKNKQFIIITQEQWKRGPELSTPMELSFASASCFKEKTLGDIITAEQTIMLDTLADNACPTRAVTLNNLDEFTLGALTMHFTLEVLLLAHLMNVNPFDQPAVEAGKQKVRDLLKNK